jgi:hypothetical protein
MTCEEFEMQFHQMLTGVLTDDEQEEVLRHRSSCLRCAAFANESERVDRMMQDLPLPELPPDLLAGLKAITEREANPAVSWGPYVIRFCAIVLPVLALYGGAALIPGLPLRYAEDVVVLAGWILFVAESILLRHIFRGYPTLDEAAPYAD